MDHWYSKKSRLKVIRYVIITGLLLSTALYAYTWKILEHDKLQLPNDGYAIVIAPGTTFKQFTKQLHTNGILPHPLLVRGYLIYKGYNKHIQTGEYL